MRTFLAAVKPADERQFNEGAQQDDQLGFVVNDLQVDMTP